MIGVKKVILLGCMFFLSGCGVQIVSPDSAEETMAEQEELIVTPSEELVTLNVVDWSDSTKNSREEMHQRFMAEHPNVTINYTTLSQTQFNETMLAGIRTGTAPDLFPLPATISFSTAMNEGWFRPLSPYVSATLFAELNPSVFNNNVTSIGEEVYLIPEVEEIPSTQMFYNKNVLKQAGVSLEQLPKTWEEFIEITQLVSEKGKGKYFGIVTSGAQSNRLDLELRSLSELAGSYLGPTEQIVLDENKTQFDSTGVHEAFSFYQNIYDRGGFHPDSASLSAPEARKVFAEDKAAFIIQGSWCIPIWRDEDPQLDFGVMNLPTKSDNKLIRPFTKGWMGISATSNYPDVAGEYLEALYSYEYQAELVSKGGFVSIRSDLDQESINDPVMQDYYRLALEQSIAIDDPITRHSNLDLVYSQIPQIAPDFGDIAASVLIGTNNYQKQLEEYNKKLQRNLESAVASVAKKHPVRISDFNYQQ